MLSTLSICPTDASIGDSRYYMIRQFAAALPTYGNDFLIHGQPSEPAPASAVLVIHDGSVDWSWGDLVASHPVLQTVLLNCHWSEAGKPFVVGTKAAFTLRGVLATLILDNVPPHMWFGDSP